MTRAKIALFFPLLLIASSCLSTVENLADDLALKAEEAARRAACDKIPDGAPLPEECGGGAGAIKSIVQTRAVVLTASDAAGSLSVINLDSHAVNNDPVAADTVADDAVVQYLLGHLIILNRSLNNVTILNPANNFSLVAQYTTVTNPQAFAAAGTDKAYITSYEENTIAVVKPFTGEKIGSIDVSEYADNDGTAEVAGAVVVEGRLFAALQLLDRVNWYSPTATSVLLVIDIASDAVSAVLTLHSTNPVDLRYDAGRKKLLVAEVGVWGMQDGGIEIIDPFSLRSEGMLVTEAQALNDLGTYAVDATGNVMFVGSDVNWNTTVNRWDATLKSMHEVTATVGWQLYCGSGNDRGEFWVCDRTAGSSGARLFSMTTGAELTDAPIATALPPKNSIVFVP